MLLIFLPAAMAHESDPEYFWLEDYVDLYSTSALDSGWLPKDGLLAVRFQVESGGGAVVEMEGESNLSWPTDLNLSFEPTPESGVIEVDATLGVTVSLKFDIDVYSWESEIANESVEVWGDAVFDPFALEGDKVDRVELTAEGVSETIFEYSYDVLAGVASVGFSAELQPQSDISFEGVSWQVEDQALTQAGEALVFPAEGQDVLEVDAAFVGAWDATLDMVFVPIFEVCISVLGCYELELTEVDINLATGAFEQAFPSIAMEFPLPVLDTDLTSHDFGGVELGNLSNLEVPLINLGQLPLEGTATIEGGEGFTVFPEYFMAGEGTTDGIMVTFAPESEGVSEAILRISSNDPTEPDLQLSLTGEGITAGTSSTSADGESTSSEIIRSCGCAGVPGGRGGGLMAVMGVLLIAARRRGDD